ncbi:hypothetical protein B4168_2894 [Anoxybacillus flavithermus]|nr:hypothetical protein B4168_2894 [Anoxybacillus flavithermus]OAO86183.1 hypothetical protein GT23_2076 [Parageobacillus thermoglucosidasius]
MLNDVNKRIRYHQFLKTNFFAEKGARKKILENLQEMRYIF